MKGIRMVVGLLAVAVVVGCNDRRIPTVSSGAPARFDANAGAGLTSVVTDPAGDASLNLKKNVGPGSDAKVPDYLDAIRVEVAKQGRTFVFTMDLMNIIPPNPTEASGGLGVQYWAWGFDTDPASFPQGDPDSPGISNASEFFVVVAWDGTQFVGLLFDRRPLLTGGEEVITPVGFTIAGATVTATVDASALGDPSTFSWDAGTLTRHAHLGSEGYQVLDHVPDAGFATWPQ